MVEFLRKNENRGIKIARVNSIRITNLSIYINFARCWESVVMLTFLNYPPVRSPLIEKSIFRSLKLVIIN